MSVAPFVIAPIAGILLALRFKVFVLIPASLLAAAVIVAVSREPKLTIALTVVGTLKVNRGLGCLEGGQRVEKINNN
jgi:hypothetical protein